MSATGYTLGISSHFHDSAAALLQDGRIVAAAQEERFTRKKGDWSFPENAIEYCLSLLPGDVPLDAVAYYENPALKIDRVTRAALSNAPSGALIWPRTLKMLQELSKSLPARLEAICPDTDRVFFVPHHRSHAASAFYPSPFGRAAVLVLDGVGEWSSTSLWNADEDGLTAMGEIRYPHSLGLFYSAFTQYCGFKVNSGEYKLMGLAPFGTPQFERKILDEILDLKADGSFALNMEYFDFATGLSTISPLFEALFGRPSRHPDEPVCQHYMNVAASAQKVLETAVVGLAAETLERTGQSNLCLAGGVALNCVANRRVILDIPRLEHLWVQPAAGDSGGALGAALDVAHRRVRRVVPEPRRAKDRMGGSLLGPGYSDEQIHDALTRYGLNFEEPESADELNESAAQALAKGHIVGHFHGRMEFGPRALGNRSILADPRPENTLSRVNRSIKFREGWRPFAPIVLAGKAADIFEEPTDSPYMLLVADLKPAFRHAVTLADARARGLHDPLSLQNAVSSQFPAATHVDFSARLQTIDPTFGSRTYDILNAFYKATGCPMLLNTSFNVRGEPIVCKPDDAIECFLNTDLDMLVIGSFVVQKSAQPDWVATKVGRLRFAAD